VGQERGSLSLVCTTEDLLGRNSSGSGQEKQYGRRYVTPTMWHPLPVKVDTNFADKLRSLDWYSLLADSGKELKKLKF
jgi:hypothetical protein